MNIANLLFTAFAGAILTLFAQAFLPDRIKTPIKYYGNYFSNRLFRRGYRVQSKMARGYDLQKSHNLDELSDELWEIFDTKPQGNSDRFVFTESRGDIVYNVDVALEWEPSSNFAVPGSEGGMETPTEELGDFSSGASQKSVESIRVAVDADLPYVRLNKYLFRSYELVRDIENEIPAKVQGRAYSISCETGQPPLINRLLARLNFNDVTATTESGLEIEIREDLVKVRNLGNSQVDEAIDKINEVVTFFG
jgi:hypothetical protein